MTSLGPYSNPYDNPSVYTQRGLPTNTPFTNSNTLLGYLRSTNTFTKYLYILGKANLEYLLSTNSIHYTIFVPTDKHLKKHSKLITSIDTHIAKKIILASMISLKMPMEILTQSPCGCFHTLNSTTDLYISGNQITVNKNCKMKLFQANIMLNNGIIHIIDDLIVPNVVL